MARHLLEVQCVARLLTMYQQCVLTPPLPAAVVCTQCCQPPSPPQCVRVQEGGDAEWEGGNNRSIKVGVGG